MNIEIRTTNKDLRSNKWFENLNNSIICFFSGENVKYTLA